MIDKDSYQRTFSALHASRDYVTEVKEMKKTKKFYMPKAAAACAALALVLGTGTIAYAADVGGIQRTIQIWMHGELTDAEMVIDDEGDYSSYSISYVDENGELAEQSGGAIAYDADGTARSLTEEELMEQIGMEIPDVYCEDDGSVWVYYYDQKIEITDKFDENGVCHVKVEKDGETLYMTIVEDGNGGYSYSSSSDKYPNEKEWSTDTMTVEGEQSIQIPTEEE